MPGEKDLRTLIENMEPELSDGEFAFAAIKEGSRDISPLRPWAIIRETEGTTVILESSSATAHGIPFESSYKRITLKIHSSLNAVGLTAAVATALAEVGISANVVAGYYHDHVFVKSEDGERALDVLQKLARG